MSIFSLDTSSKLAQAACDRRKEQFSISLPLSPPSDWHWVPRSTEFWCHPHPRVFHACKCLGAARKEALCVDLSEVKPVRNWACDGPQGDLLFHRDHSSVSSAQGHPFHLCRDTVALLETGYWCFLSFSYCLLFYRPLLCSKEMKCTQNIIFKCSAPGSRIFKV